MVEMLNIDWFNSMFTSECPVIIRNWVLPLVISLMALSLPLLVAQIHRADERFGKKGVGAIFAKTCPIKAYFICLGLTLFFLIIYFLKIPRFVEWGCTMNAIIDHSAEQLLIISASIFLGSVIWVILALLHTATNTEAMYHTFHSQLKSYFEEEGELYKNQHEVNTEFLKEDYKIAKKHNLKPLFAIIQTAILEKDAKLFNEITNDIAEGVSLYRKKIIETSANKRHKQIEYPFSLVDVCYDLAQHCFDYEDIFIQQQVFSIISTIIFYNKDSNKDVPKNGLHIDTLKLLWLIAIDAINRKRYEYAKLYWAAIFEYARKMFHSVVVMDDNLPVGCVRYELTEDDAYEKALISNVHFMWMAYVYDKKEYNLLKDLLEYYNGYREVEELNYLSLDATLINYNAALLLKYPTRDIMSIENLIEEFHYYTTIATSEVKKQQTILANFVSLIVHIYFNRWKSVPILPKNISMSEGWQSSYIEYSLLHQKAIPDIDFDHVIVEKCMVEDEIDDFMFGLLPRSDAQEIEFVKRCQVGEAHLYHLFRHTKSSLSSEFGHNQVVWLYRTSIDKHDRKIYNAEAESRMSICRDRMVYCGEEYTLYKEASRLSCGFLRSINNQVGKEYYRAINVRKNDVTIEELRHELENMSHDLRYFMFYTTEEQLNVLKTLGFNPKGERDYLYKGEYSIKCLFVEEDEYSQDIANQLWVIPKGEQPILRFVDIENKEGWKSIHEYGKAEIKSRERINRQFEQAPIFIQISDNNTEENKPLVKITLKAKIEIHGLENLHAKVLSLENINNQQEKQTYIGKNRNRNLRIFLWLLVLIYLLKRWVRNNCKNK